MATSTTARHLSPDLVAYAVTGRSGPFVPVAGWPPGVWLNEPVWRTDDDDVLMTAARGSDFWRHTEHRVTHDSGHAFLVPFEIGASAEVELTVDMEALLDQAGVLVRESSRHWLTASLAMLDGEPHVGAVHTAPHSDWSSHPVADWRHRRVSLRVSRSPHSLTVRVRRDQEAWRLVRMAPADPDWLLLAGPYVSAPARAGYTARFHRFSVTPGDASVPGLSRR